MPFTIEEPTIERVVLVVQDNPDHLHLIQNTLAASPTPHRLVALENGASAIEFLFRRGEYGDAPRPDLILLELNLPETSGRDILAMVKADPQLRRIPIVILTSTDTPTEIFNAYALQGNCYVIKSVEQDRLAQLIQRIEEFWLGIVTLPLE